MKAKEEEMNDERYAVTEHGIAWGNALIEFVLSDKKLGRCLEIRTASERLQVRVTPGGKIRIGASRKAVRKDWDNSFRADQPLWP